MCSGVCVGFSWVTGRPVHGHLPQLFRGTERGCDLPSLSAGLSGGGIGKTIGGWSGKLKWSGREVFKGSTQRYTTRYTVIPCHMILEIPLLGMYLDKIIIQKDTYTPVFTVALFTIAKTWKQPKCPWTDEWMMKMWHIYTREYHSYVKKNEIMPFAATLMDLEVIILSEEKHKYMISLKCGI